ncbi:hypothetical protein AMECASPLE_031357 [Ameca splendens]|uniref:Uncharacterized protein n=1 Tax=Ameca splendens TaxID=208324 RepID=A0ABV1A2S2_9TELE
MCGEGASGHGAECRYCVLCECYSPFLYQGAAGRCWSCPTAHSCAAFGAISMRIHKRLDSEGGVGSYTLVNGNQTEPTLPLCFPACIKPSSVTPSRLLAVSKPVPG